MVLEPRLVGGHVFESHLLFIFPFFCASPKEAKWLRANLPLMKTEKDFWAEWGPIFVA